MADQVDDVERVSGARPACARCPRTPVVIRRGVRLCREHFDALRALPARALRARRRRAS
jgi:hypothetical protein